MQLQSLFYLAIAAFASAKPGSLDPCKNGLVENAVTGQVFTVRCNYTLIGTGGKYVQTSDKTATNCAYGCHSNNCCGVQFNYAKSRCLQYQTPNGEPNCTTGFGKAQADTAAVNFKEFAG